MVSSGANHEALPGTGGSEAGDVFEQEVISKEVCQAKHLIKQYGRVKDTEKDEAFRVAREVWDLEKMPPWPTHKEKTFSFWVHHHF